MLFPHSHTWRKLLRKGSLPTERSTILSGSVMSCSCWSLVSITLCACAAGHTSIDADKNAARVFLKFIDSGFMFP